MNEQAPLPTLPPTHPPTHARKQTAPRPIRGHHVTRPRPLRRRRRAHRSHPPLPHRNPRDGQRHPYPKRQGLELLPLRTRPQRYSPPTHPPTHPPVQPTLPSSSSSRKKKKKKEFTKLERKRRKNVHPPTHPPTQTGKGVYQDPPPPPSQKKNRKKERLELERKRRKEVRFTRGAAQRLEGHSKSLMDVPGKSSSPPTHPPTHKSPAAHSNHLFLLYPPTHL